MPSRPTDNPRVSVRRMAEVNGLDLTRLQRLGQVTPEQVSGAILNCSRCRHWQTCRVDLRIGTAGLARAPGYCRNRPWFDGLRGTSQEEVTS